MTNPRKTEHKDSPFLTAKEAAAYLRIATITFYSLLGKKGGPPYKRISTGRYRIPREQFFKWCETPSNNDFVAWRGVKRETNSIGT